MPCAHDVVIELSPVVNFLLSFVEFVKVFMVKELYETYSWTFVLYERKCLPAGMVDLEGI